MESSAENNENFLLRKINNRLKEGSGRSWLVHKVLLDIKEIEFIEILYSFLFENIQFVLYKKPEDVNSHHILLFYFAQILLINHHKSSIKTDIRDNYI